MFRFRDKEAAERILKEIEKTGIRARIMHVCGTHQDTIVKYGLDDLLRRAGIDVIPGPGCPVCVTAPREIEEALMLSKKATVATFGDMMRVPGGRGISLADAKGMGHKVRVVYSVEDAVKLANEEDVVFFSIGFETTAPSIASAILDHPENFSILSCHKLIPPVLEKLLQMGEVKIDGFLLPGHVSTVIGARPYEPISQRFRIPQVIAGFEPIDVMLGVLMLLRQMRDGRSEVEIEYRRAVRYEGNERAVEIMNEVFEHCDSRWRGIGVVERSGLRPRRKYEEYDARKLYEDVLADLQEDFPDPPGCRCGEVLRGLIPPEECPLFGKACTFEHPVGPCAVSIEGACRIAMKYKKVAI